MCKHTWGFHGANNLQSHSKVQATWGLGCLYKPAEATADGNKRTPLILNAQEKSLKPAYGEVKVALLQTHISLRLPGGRVGGN